MADGVSWKTCCFSFHSRLATAARIRGLGPRRDRGKRQGIAWGRGHCLHAASLDCAGEMWINPAAAASAVLGFFAWICCT
jgi:hypothetical protein